MILARFTVLGSPQALQRHQTKSWICPVCHGQKLVQGGKCRGCFGRGIMSQEYDPSKADKADFLAKVRESAPARPLDEPLKLCVKCFFGRPKNHYGTGKKANVLKDTSPIYHTGRPDVDNLFKFIADALNGVYYRDDSVIAKVEIVKIYSDRPRVEVEIHSLTRITPPPTLKEKKCFLN